MHSVQTVHQHVGMSPLDHATSQMLLAGRLIHGPCFSTSVCSVCRLCMFDRGAFERMKPKATFILDMPDASSEQSSGTSMLHLYAFGKLAEVARPPASTVIMQLTEHQDFQMMPVRGEFIDNSSVLAEQEKDLFRCRSVYISKAKGNATDM